MTKVKLNRIMLGTKADTVTLNKALFDQLVSMLESLSELKFTSEMATREIKSINLQIAYLRRKEGI